MNMLNRLESIRARAPFVVVAPNRLRRATPPKPRPEPKSRTPESSPKSKADYSREARARAVKRGDCSICAHRKARPGKRTCEVCPKEVVQRRQQKRERMRVAAIERGTEP